MIYYVLKSAVLLALLYGGFASLLSRETFHRFNRVVLLGIVLLSLLLPAIHITTSNPTFMMRVSNILMRKATTPMKKFKDQNSHILPNKKICPSNGSLFGKPCISLGLPLLSYASSGEVYYLPASCRVVCAFMTDWAIPLS